MNRFEKSLERIKKNVFPNDKWTDDDVEHYKTVIEALEIAAKVNTAEEKKGGNSDA